MLSQTYTGASDTHTYTHPSLQPGLRVQGPQPEKARVVRLMVFGEIPGVYFSSQVSLSIALWNTTTLSSVHHHYVLCYRTACGAILWCGGELQASLPSTHTILVVGHQHLLLFWTAEPGGSSSDIRQPWEVGGMNQDAATLHLKGLAVSVAVLLLNVPPKLPASPFLQNLRLNLTNPEDAQNGKETDL